MGQAQAPATDAAVFPNFERRGGEGAGHGSTAGASVGGPSGGAQAAAGGHPGSREDADDAPPSELLAPLLEEWPDLMELVLAQLVGPGRYCHACHAVLHPPFPELNGITYYGEHHLPRHNPSLADNAYHVVVLNILDPCFLIRRRGIT